LGAPPATEGIVKVELADVEIEALAERVAELVAARLDGPRGEQWLGLEQAAAYLCSTPEAVRALVKRGRIPYHKAGGRLLFSRREVDAWVRGDPQLEIRPHEEYALRDTEKWPGTAATVRARHGR
jgi:excisionase family DNA binding protein